MYFNVEATSGAGKPELHRVEADPRGFRVSHRLASQPGQAWSVRLQTANRGGVSAFSAPVQVATPSEGSRLGLPLLVGLGFLHLLVPVSVINCPLDKWKGEKRRATLLRLFVICCHAVSRLAASHTRFVVSSSQSVPVRPIPNAKVRPLVGLLNLCRPVRNVWPDADCWPNQGSVLFHLQLSLCRALALNVHGDWTARFRCWPVSLLHA